MKHKPMTKIRSDWELIRENEMASLGHPVNWYTRNTHDGTLLAGVDELPDGWHMSISFRDHRGNLSRYPKWDEIFNARDRLLPADKTFVMILPPMDEYVALHDTTFHLHEDRREEP
jgi:hypothetical protein